MTTDKTNDTANARTCTAKSTPTSRAVLTMLANILQGNYPQCCPEDLLADALNKSPEIPGVRNTASLSEIITDAEKGVIYFDVNHGPGNFHDHEGGTLWLQLLHVFPPEGFLDFPPFTEEKPAKTSFA